MSLVRKFIDRRQQRACEKAVGRMVAALVDIGGDGASGEIYVVTNEGEDVTIRVDVEVCG